MLHHDGEKGDAFPINTFAGCLAHLRVLEGGGERRGRQKQLQSLEPLVLAYNQVLLLSLAGFLTSFQPCR